MLKKLFILFFLITASISGLAQNHSTADSINQKTYPNRSNASIYKDSISNTLPGWLSKMNNKEPKNDSIYYKFKAYNNKIIRHINIQTHDPFGYSFEDSTITAHSWFQKKGNDIHIKSKDEAIDKYILFKEGEQIDTLVLKESARLLRKQNYIRKVKISPKMITSDNDSIDIEVQVIDSWSIIPQLGITAKDLKLGLLEQNFLGRGHQLGFTYGTRYKDHKKAFTGIYAIPNIQGTFIDFNAKYEIDYKNFYNTYLSLNKEFFSPLTKWAGGALVQLRSLYRPLLNDSLQMREQNIKFFYQNYWGGFAVDILKGSSQQKRTTKLIIGARAYTLDYVDLPEDEYDPEEYFSNEQSFLGNIGVTTRQFVQDRYIFRDGEIEDVPVGAVFSLTGGLQQKNHNDRFYFGLRASYGDYFKWGFSSINIEYGTYYRNSTTEESALSIKGNYFSPLMEIGQKGWKLRQFIKPHILLGFNRINTVADRVGFNETPYYKGINGSDYIDYTAKRKFIDYKNGHFPGYESYALGTNKYMVDLQTQFYAPWNFMGFHINPFLNLGLGYLEGNGYASNKFYSSIGAGVIIRNDYLVFDALQLTFSYYPSTPGKSNKTFSGNSFRTGDYGYQDFEVGEPRTIIYE